MPRFKKFDRAGSHEVVHQLQMATARHRNPSVSQTFMRWWNVSKVLEHLLRTADEQDRRISELEEARFDLLGLPSGRQFGLPKKQTLLQKCSCGAQLEVPADAWNPAPLIATWLRTHPCSNRTSDNSLRGLGRPIH